MNFKSYFKHGVCLLVGAMMLGSCSNGNVDKFADVINDDVFAVVMVRPDDILKSFDATIKDGRLELPEDLKKQIDKEELKEVNDVVKDLEGIDRSQVMAMVYLDEDFTYNDLDHPERYMRFACVAVLKDQASLEKTLKKYEFEKGKSNGLTTYENGIVYVVLSDDLVWLVADTGRRRYSYYGYEEEPENEFEAGKVVKDLIAKAEEKPLEGWKLDLIEDNADKEAVAFVCGNTNLLFPMLNYEVSALVSVDLDGSKAEALYEIFDAEGNRFDIDKFVNVDYIDEVSQFIGEEDMFAAAYGANGLAETMMRGLGRELGPDGRDALKLLTGEIAVSVNPKKTKIDALSDLENYQGIVALGVKPGKAEELMKLIKGLDIVEKSGEGFKIDDTPFGTIQGRIEDDFLVMTTKGYKEDDRMGGGDLDDYVTWANFKLTPEFGLFKEAKIKYGVEVDYDATMNAAKYTVEITNSDYSFAHALIDMALSAEKNL